MNSEAQLGLGGPALEARLSAIRHDLRTPLNAVLCFAQLLELEDLSAKQREYVAHILAGGRALAGQIDALRSLSADETPEAAAQQPPCDAHAALRDPEEVRDRSVLYVEDNPTNLELVRQALDGAELTLVAARDGAEGLELAREHAFDLVLLDLQLPDMSGEEVLSRLRADAATRTTPVLVLTADATSGRAEQLLSAGAAAYLTKPLDIRRFREQVSDALGAGR